MKIHIKNLTLPTIIGVYSWERNTPRDLILHLTLQLQSCPGIETDQIEDTVNYDQLADVLRHAMAEKHFMLLEALVHHLLNAIGQAFPLVSFARITIDKPGVVQETATVSVEAERHYP